MYKALLILAAIGTLFSAFPAAGSCEPGKSIYCSYLGDSRISTSGLEDLVGNDRARYDLASYYRHAQQYMAAAQPQSADRSSRSASVSIRPARTPRFELSIQDISRLTLYLNLNHSIRADLDLYQSCETVFGKGNLTSGNLTWEVGATGALDHDRLALDLVTQEGDIYKLNLQGGGQSLSGEYAALSPDGRTWSGSATSSLPHQP